MRKTRIARAITLPAAAGTGTAKLTFDGDQARVIYAPSAPPEGRRTDGVLQSAPSPVKEALSRGRITAEQHLAATRLAADRERSCSSGALNRGTPGRMNGSAPRHAATERAERYAAVRLAFTTAAEFIAETMSPLHRDILVRVVIDEMPASHAARAAGLPARNGIMILRQALTALAGFYEELAAKTRARATEAPGRVQMETENA